MDDVLDYTEMLALAARVESAGLATPHMGKLGEKTVLKLKFSTFQSLYSFRKS